MRARFRDGRRLAGLVAALVPLAFAAGAQANTFHVTRTDDPPPNGCKKHNCSLREAVRAANATAAGDTVVLKGKTYELTIEGDNENAAATGDLDVRHDLAIRGAGARATKIEGAWATNPDRLVEVRGSRTGLKITGATLRDGNAGDYLGSGITVTKGSLALSGVNLTSMDEGYAIDNFGDARLKRVRFTNNSTPAGCCAAFYDESKSTVRMTNVSFVGNHAGQDTGAMYSQGALAVLKNVTFADNTAGAVGGGALIPSSGTTSLTNVTFDGNSTTGSGGAIYLDSSATLKLNDVTIAGNTADSDANGSGNGGGLINGSGGGVTNMQNTIIAANTDMSPVTVAPDCAQQSGDAFTSTGHNLIGDESNCSFTPLGSDQVGTGGSPLDPMLAPLADNGGFTETRALQTGSPAINKGSPKTPGSGGTACAKRDQRGVKRPQGPRCDIGAYEKKQ